jgi:Pentapeptide repeats (9 copies)
MSPQVTAAIIAVGGVVLTVIATVAVQISGRRATSQDTQKTLAEQREQLNTTLTEQHKQLDRTLAEQRTRTLNERFATAAGQLGSDKPAAVRLAGVYAMAGLADDWPENRQTCVDVLCAYLRLPYDPDPGDDVAPAERAAYRADREVRHTVIRVIAAHLKAGAAVSWQGLNFDFTGVVFDGGDFTTAEFSGGTVRLTGAEFSGGDVYFGGTPDFDGRELSGGEPYFNDAKFSGGTVSFGHAEFTGGTVDFDGAEFSGGEVDFSGVSNWSVPPTFPWADTPPRGVKLPRKDDQSQT